MRKNRSITRANAKKVKQEDKLTMGLKGVTGYTFRHTIITDIYEITHDANIASAVAGHSKTTTTMNRYAHARQDATRKGISAIDQAYLM